MKKLSFEEFRDSILDFFGCHGIYDMSFRASSSNSGDLFFEQGTRRISIYVSYSDYTGTWFLLNTVTHINLTLESLDPNRNIDEILL